MVDVIVNQAGILAVHHQESRRIHMGLALSHQVFGIRSSMVDIFVRNNLCQVVKKVKSMIMTVCWRSHLFPE